VSLASRYRRHEVKRDERRRHNIMHAIDIQKRIIDLMSEIDDTSPLPKKDGRILVLVNALGAEIAFREHETHNDEPLREAFAWMQKAIHLLPGSVATMGNYGSRV
jgi:hypothetical protein